jgi:hypothetical protein
VKVETPNGVALNSSTIYHLSADVAHWNPGFRPTAMPAPFVPTSSDVTPNVGFTVRVLANTVMGAFGKQRLEVEDVTVIRNDQAWFYTPEWQAGEDRADEEANAGLGVRYASLDDFLKDLP